MIRYLFMNLIAITSAFLINYKILKLSNFIDSLASLFILYFAQIVITELLLGIPGMLYINNLIFLNLAILLAVWYIAKQGESSFKVAGFRAALDGLLKNKVILLCVSVIAGFGLVKIFINLINPPFGWDDLNYHFTFPVEWLKHGNLNNPITISDDPSPSYYPINGSLLFLWLMFPLRNVFLADLGQVPFFFLAFLAIFSISKKLKLNNEFAFYAATLFLIIPNVFKQLKIAYVDIMVAALFLVCVLFLFLLNEKFSVVNTFVYSASLGLLLGTKTVALPYSVLLFIPFLYLWIKNFNKSALFVFSIVIIVIFGGFTYLRNFIDTGNPLYPLDFKLLGRHIFKGVMDSSVYGAHFKISDYRISKLLFHEGLGAQTIIFILPAIFLALPVTFIKKRKLLDFNLAYFLVLPVLVYLAYRYIIPLANTRYLYPLLGTGIIIGFYVADTLKIPKVILRIIAVICIFASMPELARHAELIAAILLTFLLFFALPVLIKVIQNNSWIKKPISISILVILLTAALIFLEKNYLKNEYAGYIKMQKYSGFWPDAVSAWNWLNSNTKGNNIAYTGRPVAFPLYGTGLKNNVYYVSVNHMEPVKLHYFKDSRYRWDGDFLNLHRNLEKKGNYRSGADYSAWLSNLSKRNIDYLFIYSLHQTKEVVFPLEDEWAQKYIGKFRPVFTNATVRIYRISKDITYGTSY